MPDDQQHPFVAAVQRAWPPAAWRNVNVVAAVSGGADSVAMLRGLVQTSWITPGAGEIVVAHFDHGWRGAASAADARFVAELARGLGCRILTGGCAASAASPSEESARQARYDFLRDAACRVGARYVATAHNREDQIETVIHRVLRGSGIGGLAGIPALRPLAADVTLVRPLLAVARAQIEAYLSALGQQFRRDASNASHDFTRNWVRHELLPRIGERFGDSAGEALLSLAAQADEWRAWMASQAAGLRRRAFRWDPGRGGYFIRCNIFRGEAGLLVREACRLAWRQADWREQGMGAEHWRRLERFLTASSPGPAILLPGGIRGERRGAAAHLGPAVGVGRPSDPGLP